MSTLTFNLDDDAAGLVEQAARAANQPLEKWLRETVLQAAEHAVSTVNTVPARVSPLHPGAMKPASDFNAPLEEFAPYV